MGEVRRGVRGGSVRAGGLVRDAAGWVVDVRMGRRWGGDGERRFEGATNRASAGKTRTWEDTKK